MQKIHNFKISIADYSKNGKDNDFPKISRCPHCHDNMIKNGFYTRYVISFSKTHIIYIQRYRCKHCGLSLSLLPSFLLPYFQRSLRDIFTCIQKYLKKRKFIFDRRTVFLYLQRFRANIPAIISFFRDTIDPYISFHKRKAIKLIEMIKSCPAHTFSRRFHNHFNIGFMAL